MKYKYKYQLLKNQLGGNDKYLNIAIRRFGKDLCLDTLYRFFIIFPGITRLSIGSGNGYFEHLYSEKFKDEPPIICIDPNPLSYESKDLVKPFTRPEYPTAEAFKAVNPETETVLFINWSGPDPENTYDIDAIKLLKPLAFFIIYAERDSGLSHQAGSDELISFIDTFSKTQVNTLDDQQYIKMSSWQGRESNLRFGWYLNLTKDEKNKTGNWSNTVN